MIKKSLGELNHRKFWYTIVMDIAFLVILILFATLTRAFIESIYKKITIFANLAILFVYILGLAWIYSFFKYKILGIISDVEHKTGLIGFYLFNLTILGIIAFIIILSYALITYIVKLNYQGIYLLVVIILVSLAGYFVVNIMQMLKVTAQEVSRVMGILRKNVSGVMIAFALEVGGIIVLYLIYMLTYYLTKGMIKIDPVFQVISVLFILVYNAFNRILFFNYTIRQT